MLLSFKSWANVIGLLVHGTIMRTFWHTSPCNIIQCSNMYYIYSSMNGLPTQLEAPNKETSHSSVRIKSVLLLHPQHFKIYETCFMSNILLPVCCQCTLSLLLKLLKRIPFIAWGKWVEQSVSVILMVNCTTLPWPFPWSYCPQIQYVSRTPNPYHMQKRTAFQQHSYCLPTKK